LSQVVWLSLLTESVAFTLSEMPVLAGRCDRAKGRIVRLGELVCRGYCLSEWIAFGLVAIYRPRLFEAWWLLDYFLTALVIAWVADFQRAARTAWWTRRRAVDSPKSRVGEPHAMV
jgi:hypothetical protein